MAFGAHIHMTRVFPSGDSTAEMERKLTGKVQRNFSHADQAHDVPAPGVWPVVRLALIELADRVFDVLTQQAPFFRRHVTVATTLIEIGGNCSTHHDV